MSMTTTASDWGFDAYQPVRSLSDVCCAKAAPPGRVIDQRLSNALFMFTLLIYRP